MNTLKKWLVVLLFFIYLYYPPIIKQNILHFVGIISLVWSVININKVKKYFSNKYFFLLIILLIFGLVYTFIISMLNGTNIVANTRIYIVALFELIPFSIMISIYLKDNNYTYIDVLKFIVLVGCIQGIVSIFSFYSSGFHNWFLNRLLAYGFDHSRYSSLGLYRLYGMGYSLTFFTPLVQSILSAVSFYIAFHKDKRYYLPFLIISFSAVINARTAFVIIPIGILLAVIDFKNMNKKQAWNIIIIGLLSFVIIWVFLEFILVEDNWFAGWIKSGVDSIIMLFKGEKTGYFAYLTEERFTFPSGLSFLFGKGTFIYSGLNGVQSDVGYVNYVWLGGLVYLSYVMYLFYYLISLIKKVDIKESRFLYKFLIFTILVINIKGTLFDLNEFINLLIFMSVFSITYCMTKKDKKENTIETSKCNSTNI